jgi:hypothetical protein
MLEQCDEHFWINGALITAVNNAEFLGKVTNGDMITVLSSVMKAYKAIG